MKYSRKEEMLLNAEEGKGRIRAFHRQNWSEAWWVEKRGQQPGGSVWVSLCAEEVMADISLGDLPSHASGRFMGPFV